MDFGKHEALSKYLQYTENTESPKLTHVWSFLSGVSACLGRRCWYDNGIDIVWPNMYIIISGPPGGRKSSAIKYTKQLLKNTATIRFAPDDTGGQRQGLIKAMTDVGDEEIDDVKIGKMLAEVEDMTTFSSLAPTGGEKRNGHVTAESLIKKLENIQFDMRDPRTMFIFASELKSFIGENNNQMLTFLLKLWEGDDYTYELRNSSYKITDGLLGILGATTPSELATMLPPGAMGSGFTSRVIFVYASGRNRKIPRPSLDASVRGFLEGTFANLFERFNGPFVETPDAATVYDEIYNRGTSLKDPRFTHYCERRHTHLQKAALSICAARGTQQISGDDIRLADQLLTLTEEFMPDALGEYGMNKESIAIQQMLEYVNSSIKPIPMPDLHAMMVKQMNGAQFQNAIMLLHNSGKISRVVLDGLGECVVGVSDLPARRARKELATIRGLLSNG